MFRTAETINCFALDILKEIFGQVLRIIFNIKKKKIKCIFPTAFFSHKNRNYQVMRNVIKY